MDDVTELRDRATRLFALALRAADTGQFAIADELAQLGSEALSHADAIERRWAPIRRQVNAEDCGYGKRH